MVALKISLIANEFMIPQATFLTSTRMLFDNRPEYLLSANYKSTIILILLETVWTILIIVLIHS